MKQTLAQNDPELELLTIQEVSVLLKRSRSTIYQDARNGLVELVRLGPQSTRISVAELRRYRERLSQRAGAV